MPKKIEQEKVKVEQASAEPVESVEPVVNPQRDKLDKRISELETRALSLEERAEYAEKEAQLRKRIRGAEDKIRATQPPGVFAWLSGSIYLGLGGVWGRIPTLVKFLLVLGVLVAVVLLLVGKSCAGGG